MVADEEGRGRISPVEEVELLRAAACDWRLSRGDVGVFAAILMHCDADGEAFPGPTRLSQLARLAVTNVKACIRHLEQLRYIEVVRPGLRKANRYRILQSPKVMPRKHARAIAATSRQLGTRAFPALGTKSSPVGGPRSKGN